MSQPGGTRRARPRPSVVLSMLAAVAATALWVAAAVTLFQRDRFFAEGVGLLWLGHGAVVVVGAALLWRWWHELLAPDTHRERPPEPDEPAPPHRGLSGQDPPPRRW